MPAEIFCGIVPADHHAWPFNVPLVVEIEIKPGCLRVSDIHLNVDLPALRGLLQAEIRGMPVAHVSVSGADVIERTYHASYIRCIVMGLILAVREFKERRLVDWIASHRLANSGAGPMTPGSCCVDRATAEDHSTQD